jgi:hypothetical protein
MVQIPAKDGLFYGNTPLPPGTMFIWFLTRNEIYGVVDSLVHHTRTSRIYVRIYSLFNDAFSKSQYAALNDLIIVTNELRMLSKEAIMAYLESKSKAVLVFIYN